MNAQEEGCIITSQGAEDSLYEAMQMGIICTRKLLYFELSPPWHLYVLLLANLLAFYLTYLLAFYLAYLLAFYLAYLLAFYLAYLLQYVLAYLLALYLAYLLTFYLAYVLANILALYLAYLLAFYLAVEVQPCSLSSEGPRLRSSGAHWARRVPGCGPAVPSALRPLQLRSSSGHCVRKLAKSLAKSWQGGSGYGSGGRGGGGERGGGGRRGGEEQLW